MKLFRYRKRSVSTTLGLTKLKKRTNKALGITALMKPARAPGNFMRKLKRNAGYYSEPAKALRYASKHMPKTKKKVVVYTEKVKVVHVGHGFFGKPNVRGIQKAIQKWLRKGYILKQQSVKNRSLFSFGYTALTFVQTVKR